jgi:1-acyl-sn-glycerol-3-phosphate acyltransferase
MVRRILQPFFTAYVIIIFSVSILAIFPFFVLIALGNNANARKVIFTIIRYWSRFWLWSIGMPVTVLGSQPPSRKYVVVANHISYLDTIVIFQAIQGYFRPLGKKEISRIPVVGFIYKQIVIMVDRSNPHSRTRSMRLMWQILKKEANIIIFPEGTFNETGAVLKDFYDGAFRLAIATQTPLLPVIFPDTVQRWHYSHWWKIWPGRNRAVFLPVVEVSGMGLEHLPQLKQTVYALMENELKKYDYP